jgi:heme exporter protein D
VHSIVWFFTTGRFDPAWVLVVLTIVTLIVLGLYAWDTHTLAKMSVEQMKATEQQLKVAQQALTLSLEENEQEKKVSSRQG